MFRPLAHHPHNMAHGLASLGRHGDSMLVHMSPAEVGGLQKLAMAHGGSLTTNPETGLPEASFLSSILPTIAGAALNIMFPGLGALGSAAIVGGADALAEGNIRKGLLAGLGAYGGAGLAGSLGGFGSAAGAAGSAGTAGTMSDAEYLRLTGLTPAEAGISATTVPNVVDPVAEAQGLTLANPTQAVASTAAPAASSVAAPAATDAASRWAAVKSGLSNINPFTSSGINADPLRNFVSANKLNSLAALAPSMYAQNTPQAAAQQKAQYYVPAQGYKSLWRPGIQNPDIAKYGYLPAGEQAFIDQGWNPGEFSTTAPTFSAKKGGEVKKFAMGGTGSAYTDFGDYGFGSNYTDYTTGGNSWELPAIDTSYYPQYLPDTAYDTSTATPDTSTATPDTSTATPDTSTATPDTTASSDNFNPDMEAANQIADAASTGTTNGMEELDVTSSKYNPDLAFANWIADNSGATSSGTVNTGVNLDNVDTNATALGDLGNPAIFSPGPINTGIAGAVDGSGGGTQGNVNIGTGTGTGTGTGQVGPWFSDTSFNNPNQPSTPIKQPPSVAGLNPRPNVSDFNPSSNAQMNDYYRRMWTGASQEPVLNAPVSSGQGINQYLNNLNTMVTPAAVKQATGVAPGPTSAGSITPTTLAPPPTIPGMAHGGHIHGGLGYLGNTYAAGGKLLRGPGDGMSDSIPAVIKGKKPQRAALADGEFVVPADVVSHLGNGSTEAGSKKLYDMMDKIRMARTGRKAQGKQINPDRFLPR